MDLTIFENKTEYSKLLFCHFLQKKVKYVKPIQSFWKINPRRRNVGEKNEQKRKFLKQVKTDKPIG